MCWIILAVSTAWSGYYEENGGLVVAISGGEPVNLRAHIRAVSGLTAPAASDYRLEYQGGQSQSQVYDQSGHNALKAASSNCNTSFPTQAITTLGSTFWSSLNAAEKADACNIYKAVNGSPAFGISAVYHYEIHQVQPPFSDLTANFDQSLFSSLRSEAISASDVDDYDPTDNTGWPGFSSGTWGGLNGDTQVALWQLMANL